MEKENQPTEQDNSEKPASADSDSIIQLRAARDAAISAAQTAIRDTTRLTRLLTILSEPAPLDELLDRVLSTLSELFSADVVILLDPAEKGSYVPLAAIGLPEDLIQKPFSHLESSYTFEVMKSHIPLRLEGLDSDINCDFQIREVGAMTSAWLPVTDNFTVRGVLILVRCWPLPFTHDEVDLLSAMTYRIGLSLEQAQRSLQLKQISQAGREIVKELDRSTIVEKVVSMFPAIIGADAAVLYLNDDSGKPECAAENGFDHNWGPICIRLTEYLISDAQLNGIRLYNSSEQDQVIDRFFVEISAKKLWGSLLAVPVQYQGQIQGFLFGIRNSEMEFNLDTQQVAMLFASQTSSALENARLYCSVRDELVERRQIEQALRVSHDRFRALIRSVSDVISILTAQGQISYVSPAAEVAWGCSPKSLLNQNFFEQIHPEDNEEVRQLFSELQNQPNATLTHTIRLRYGNEDRWRIFEAIFTNLVDEAAISGIVVTCHDITERKIYEQELSKLAFHDPLTGLFNRASFRDHLQHAIIQAGLENKSIGVIFVDLDDFKIVNDTMGHAWGDQLLCIIADRMRSCLRKNDIAARIGGDEFTILVEEISSINQIMLIVNRLINIQKEPIWLKDNNLFVSSSIGVAISASNQDSADDLLRKADIAMYKAKSQGKGGYAVYDAKLDDILMKQLESEMGFYCML